MPETPAPLSDALRHPLLRLLRPLVRLLMQSGITFPVLADLLRGIYVDVAIRDLLKDPKAQTDSRISLLTGVHRKELRRLRLQPAPMDEAPATVTLSSQIIGRWLGLPPWAEIPADSLTGRDPKPRVLPRTTPAEKPGKALTAVAAASFESLVLSVTRDMRPRAILDEWLSQGIVTLDDDDMVHLNDTAFIPQPGREEQLFYFARNLHDHIAAASSNVAASGRAPFLDRSVHYDRLTAETAVRLEQLGREAAHRLLVDINSAALRMIEQSEAEGAGDGEAALHRVNLGVYLYAEEEPGGTVPASGDDA